MVAVTIAGQLPGTRDLALEAACLIFAQQTDKIGMIRAQIQWDR
ncbi:MAG: hypothetical protein ACUVT0_03800 [Thermochromatium sp.]